MTIALEPLITRFIEENATDLYLTVGAIPSLRLHSVIIATGSDIVQEDDIQSFLEQLLSPEALAEFESTLEYNTAINWQKRARFRINVFRQQQHTGIVMRRIRTDIPTLESLGLPPSYGQLIMEKRGLVLVVGPTGSGKSTSLAAMLEHRNRQGSGHIVTIEDPVEFLHQHRNCIITQRDVGIDTYSFGIALKNALRQSPDVIVIGEIRDRETMEHAIVFSETGHLCLATLHANNAYQAIERIVNFFPEEKHKQVLMNLSLNLRGILSQRLVPNIENTRTIALEVMLNHGLIRNLIQEGRIKEMHECIEKARDEGMQSFDQALFDLYTQGIITEETALAESDNPANLRLTIKQHTMSQRSGPFRTLTPEMELLNRPLF